MTRAYRICVVPAIVALASCTTYAPVSRDTASEPSAPEAGNERDVSIERESADPRSQTLNAMLDRARADRLSGRLADAEATLEAALRIAPSDARLWLELAETQFAAGDFATAGTLAQRAMSLAGGNLQIIEAGRRIRSHAGE